MSETPRTDALAEKCVGVGSPMSYVRAIDLCRELEQQLAESQKHVKNLLDLMEEDFVDNLTVEQWHRWDAATNAIDAAIDRAGGRDEQLEAVSMRQTN